MMMNQRVTGSAAILRMALAARRIHVAVRRIEPYDLLWKYLFGMGRFGRSEAAEQYGKHQQQRNKR